MCNSMGLRSFIRNSEGHSSTFVRDDTAIRSMSRSPEEGKLR